MSIHVRAAIAIVLLSSVTYLEAPSAAEPAVRVRAYAQHAGGLVVYHYQIENRGREELRRVALGCDCRADRYPVASLRVAPMEYPPEYQPPGTPMALPPERVSTPPGWQVHARRLRPDGRYWIEWHAVGPRGLGAGQVAKGFSIALPRHDPAFLHGRFSAPDREFVGTVETLDGTPPRLSLRLEPAAPPRADGTVQLRVVAHAVDDFDPAPRVEFESFVPADPMPAGTIRWVDPNPEARPVRYIVTYRASDASGNTARLQLPVTVPRANPGVGALLPTALQLPGLIP